MVIKQMVNDKSSNEYFCINSQELFVEEVWNGTKGNE